MCWRPTAGGGDIDKREEADKEVSAVRRGVEPIIPGTVQSVAGSIEAVGMRRLSTVVW